MAEVSVVEKNETALDAELSRVYEVGYQIIPTVQEEKLDGAVNAIRATIEQAHGSLVSEGAPELMKLAYPIERHEHGKNTEYDRGYFGWIKFEAAPETLKTLDEAFKHDANILRFIIFRTVREETRARMKIATLREVRRTDTIKASPRKAEESAAPVSEEDLDKAIEELTTE